MSNLYIHNILDHGYSQNALYTHVLEYSTCYKDPVYSAGAGRAQAERSVYSGLQSSARANFNLSIFCRSGALHVNKRLFGGAPFERLL